MWRSRALYVQRQTCHHSESTNAPAIDLNQLCTGIVHLLSSQWQKNANFQYVEIVPTKKRNWCYDHDLDTFAISCGKVYNTNLPRCLKLWLSIWQPCDTGLRPPFVGLGFMVKLENWKLLSWCFRGSYAPQASDCTCGPKISLLSLPKCMALTLRLKQR